MWSRNKINSVLATIYFISAPSVRTCIMHYANDTKTFLKHFSDCLFYFCSTCADSINSRVSNTKSLLKNTEKCLVVHSIECRREI